MKRTLVAFQGLKKIWTQIGPKSNFTKNEHNPACGSSASITSIVAVSGSNFGTRSITNVGCVIGFEIGVPNASSKIVVIEKSLSEKSTNKIVISF